MHISVRDTDIGSGAMAVEDPPTTLGPDQAIPAIEEEEDLAEDEVEVNPNLFFFLRPILRAIAETE